MNGLRDRSMVLLTPRTTESYIFTLALSLRLQVLCSRKLTKMSHRDILAQVGWQPRVSWRQRLEKAHAHRFSFCEHRYGAPYAVRVRDA